MTRFLLLLLLLEVVLQVVLLRGDRLLGGSNIGEKFVQRKLSSRVVVLLGLRGDHLVDMLGMLWLIYHHSILFIF